MAKSYYSTVFTAMGKIDPVDGSWSTLLFTLTLPIVPMLLVDFTAQWIRHHRGIDFNAPPGQRRAAVEEADDLEIRREVERHPGSAP